MTQLSLPLVFVLSIPLVVSFAFSCKNIWPKIKNKLLQNFFPSSFSLMVLVDKKGKIISVNHQFSPRHDFSAKELVGQSLQQSLLKNYAAPTMDNMWQSLQQGQVWNDSDVKFTLKETTHHVQVGLIPFRDENLQPYQYLLLVSDQNSSWQKQQMKEMALQVTCQQLKESEDRFKSMVNMIPQMISIFNFHQGVLWCNQVWYDFTGLTIEDCQKGLWVHLHHPDHYERVMKSFKISCDQLSPWEEIFPLKNQKGLWRWFLCRTVPFHNQDGEIIYWYATYTDINQFLVAQAELQQSDQIREDFLSIAGHELKTPLTSLMLETQSLKRMLEKEAGEGEHFQLRMAREEKERKKIKKFIEQCERQTMRLNRLVEDVLDVGRIHSQKLGLQKELFSLTPMIEETIERMKPLLNHMPIYFHIPVAKNKIEVYWDKLRIEQVLNNLLINAMKYGQQKEVEIHLFDLELKGQQVVQLRVQDQGMGIEKEKLQKIFQRFERGISYHEVSGLGLGLYISEQIVKNHGGDIWAESEGLGKGSTFIVQIPKKTNA